MFRNLFEHIAGVAILPSVALIFFFGFFTALLFWLWRMDAGQVRRMENLPLDPDNGFNGGLSHE